MKKVNYKVPLTAKEREQQYLANIEDLRNQMNHANETNTGNCPRCNRPWNGIRCTHCAYPQEIITDKKKESDGLIIRTTPPPPEKKTGEKQPLND